MRFFECVDGTELVPVPVRPSSATIREQTCAAFRRYAALQLAGGNPSYG